jgi:exonuclease VII large subunit
MSELEDKCAKCEELEKELEIWKSKTQLARNYSIVVAENNELKKELSKKKEYWEKKVKSSAPEVPVDAPSE